MPGRRGAAYQPPLPQSQEREDTIKIMSAAGGGTPVIAVVGPSDRIMLSGDDLSMNQCQMEKILGVP